MTVSKSIIHFAHANGIPLPSYGPLLDALEAQRVIGKPMLAHDPKFPPNNQWSNIADEIIDYIENNASQPVIGIGHSLGSVCTFIAAQKRPDLFNQVIMLDPPIIYGPASFAVKALKRFNKLDHFTPAGKSKNRKQVWTSLTEATEYFQSKRLYNSFHPECFNGYLGSALRHTNDGVELGYLVDHEVALFRTPPDNFSSYKHPSPIPIHIVYGDKSDASFPKYIKPFARRFGAKQLIIPGEHMFPLQNPIETAEIINELLSQETITT